MDTFIANLTAAVTAAGITWAEVASRSGIDQSNLSRIRHGREGLSVDRAAILAGSIGYTISEMTSARFKPRKKLRACKTPCGL